MFALQYYFLTLAQKKSSVNPGISTSFEAFELFSEVPADKVTCKRLKFFVV